MMICKEICKIPGHDCHHFFPAWIAQIFLANALSVSSRDVDALASLQSRGSSVRHIFPVTHIYDYRNTN